MDHRHDWKHNHHIIRSKRKVPAEGRGHWHWQDSCYRDKDCDAPMKCCGRNSKWSSMNSYNTWQRPVEKKTCQMPYRKYVY